MVSSPPNFLPQVLPQGAWVRVSTNGFAGEGNANIQSIIAPNISSESNHERKKPKLKNILQNFPGLFKSDNVMKDKKSVEK